MTRRRGERGAVTAELAMGLPLLLALTVGLTWLVGVGTAQVRAVDAAREAARAVARGDSEAEGVSVARAIAPGGSSISVVTEGERVVVRVRASVRGPGGLFDGLPGAEIGAEAVALAEGSP